MFLPVNWAHEGGGPVGVLVGITVLKELNVVEVGKNLVEVGKILVEVVKKRVEVEVGNEKDVEGNIPVEVKLELTIKQWR